MKMNCSAALCHPRKQDERGVSTATQGAAAWTIIAAVFLMAVGIFARFYHLGEKVYWMDEVATSIHISGHRISDVHQMAGSPLPLNAGDLVDRYQRLQPGRGIKDITMGLARTDTEHPPLYYVLLYGWAKLFGTSSAALRSMSAVAGVAAIGLMFWLGMELFDNRRAALWCAALFAISPIQVLYAQEAREYALWVGLFLLSSTLLLRAMRRPSAMSWGLYALSMAAGCYTDVLMLAVMAAHGIYVAASVWMRSSSGTSLTANRALLLKQYAVSAVTVLLAFFPWITILAIQFIWRHRISLDWLDSPVSTSTLFLHWIRNFATTFADFNNGSVTFGMSGAAAATVCYFVASACVLLTVYALYRLCRNSPPRAWLFVMAVVAVFTIPFLAADLLKGGHRSLIPRYTLPLFAMAVVAVGWVVADRLRSSSAAARWAWRVAAAMIVVLSLNSLWRSSDAVFWWNKYVYAPVQIARTINMRKPAMVVSSLEGANTCQLLSICRRIKRNTPIRMVLGPDDIPSLTNISGDIFFIEPSEVQRQTLARQGYLLGSLDAQGDLWRIAKPAAP